jgi:transposase-like protein
VVFADHRHAERTSLQKQQRNLGLTQPLSEAAVSQYQQHQGELQGRIDQLQSALEQLKQRRKQTPRQILVQDLPETDRFTRLRTERKYFLDTIKMIAYRAETSMAATVREKLKRNDDARALLRQIFNTEVDLIQDLAARTLTVCLHHLTQAAHDTAVRFLCDKLTATETDFPGTDLRLIYKLGST